MGSEINDPGFNIWIEQPGEIAVHAWCDKWQFQIQPDRPGQCIASMTFYQAEQVARAWLEYRHFTVNSTFADG